MQVARCRTLSTEIVLSLLITRDPHKNRSGCTVTLTAINKEHGDSCLFPCRDSHMKRSGMLVVSLRGINQGFCSHIGCSGQNATIFSCQRIFYGALEEITLRCSSDTPELCIRVLCEHILHIHVCQYMHISTYMRVHMSLCYEFP